MFMDRFGNRFADFMSRYSRFKQASNVFPNRDRSVVPLYCKLKLGETTKAIKLYAATMIVYFMRD